MEGIASAITVTYTTRELVQKVKKLVQSVRQRYENAKELEDRLENFNTILCQAEDLYGKDPNDSNRHLPGEQPLRQSIKRLVHRCDNDLKKFESDLKKLVDHGNWVSAAWRQHTVVPQLDRIEDSISSHHQRLSMLIQLLQGYQMNRLVNMQQRMIEMLKILTNNDTAAQTALSNENQLADTELLVSQVAALIGDGKAETPASEGGSSSLEDQEHNKNGILLLQAIEDGNHDDFGSLLRDGTTSLNEKNGKERTPLLLAANLDKSDMISMLLTDDASASNQISTRILVPWDKPADDTSLSPTGEEGNVEENMSYSHREIDLTAIDSIGRTALHYCAEFDLCKSARFLLDHGVDVNARDNCDCPPLYFAVKWRKWKAIELLLSKGASTDFTWWEPTSDEVKKLLEKETNVD